jgi:hypothetical protein
MKFPGVCVCVRVFVHACVCLLVNVTAEILLQATIKNQREGEWLCLVQGRLSSWSCALEVREVAGGLDGEKQSPRLDVLLGRTGSAPSQPERAHRKVHSQHVYLSSTHTSKHTHTRTHACTHTHSHTHTHTRTHAYTHMHTHTPC